MSRNLENILGTVNANLTPDPLTHIRCTQSLQDSNIANVNKNPAFVKFLTQDKFELNNTATTDSSDLINLCNPNRLINIITLYMIHFLGLDTAAFINNYVYNHNADFKYPATWKNIWAPKNITTYPNLEQSFWSVVQQYTTVTEVQLRQGKDVTWCPIIGDTVYLHCKDTIINSCSSMSSSEQDDFCKNKVWNYFIENCHRTLNQTTVGKVTQ